jgi:hypothetical protein
MARDLGRQLILRRYFSYELVPRREGTIRIPEIRIPYFDPETRLFKEVLLRESALTVTPAPAVAAEARRERARSPAEREEEGTRGWGLGWLGLLAGLAAALTLLGLAVHRLWLSRRASPWGRIASALEQAEAARDTGENAAAAKILAQALRIALEARVPGARALTAEQILERAEDEPTRKLAERLERLDRERFQPSVPPPEIHPLRSALEELRRSRR